jgi:hypothetical protein
MIQKLIVFGVTVALTTSIARPLDTTRAQTTLSAAQVVEKNVAATGGLQGWRAVQTMSEEGKLGVGGNQRATLSVPPQGGGNAKPVIPTRPKDEAQLPFTMYMQRPRKTRFELKFKSQTAVQVFDGTNGWKLRPYLNRTDPEPFTQDEIKLASTQNELDGPLIDYAAKGTKIELDGIEAVEGQDAYKLKLTFKDGRELHLWIDAKSFLETKVDGNPRRLDGKLHPVEVYYRDYRTVSGLQIPFVIETHVLSVGTTAQGFKDTPVPPEKIIIEKVVVNPKLAPSLFQKPEETMASNR